MFRVEVSPATEGISFDRDYQHCDYHRRPATASSVAGDALEQRGVSR